MSEAYGPFCPWGHLLGSPCSLEAGWLAGPMASSPPLPLPEWGQNWWGGAASAHSTHRLLSLKLLPCGHSTSAEMPTSPAFKFLRTQLESQTEDRDSQPWDSDSNSRTWGGDRHGLVWKAPARVPSEPRCLGQDEQGGRVLTRWGQMLRQSRPTYARKGLDHERPQQIQASADPGDRAALPGPTASMQGSLPCFLQKCEKGASSSSLL